MAQITKSSSTKKASPASNTEREESLLNDLFIDELKDIYWAEKHLTKALPKMQKAATSQELANALEDHLAVTEKQIDRLEEVFSMLDMPARAKKCEGMEGLVKEGQGVMEEMPKGTAARDAGIIISSQKIEHYEIAAYGSLVQLAKTMGKNDIATLLQETLDEEKEADKLLSQLAVSSINISADNEKE